VGRAGCYAALERPHDEIAAYRTALSLKPDDVRLWMNIGIAYSNEHIDDVEKAEEAFRQAVSAAPDDARPPLTLGRYLAKLSRPAEAIEQFYDAALLNADYFDEVKLGVGTARAQQGRLTEATTAFESASRMKPSDAKLKASLEEMRSTAAKVEAYSVGMSNALTELCGTPCQDVIDASGISVCAISWADGCGDAPPPDGFSAQSTVAELCGLSCAFYLYSQRPPE